MQTTTDQIRQVLMNELGLTRESIRDMVEKIVTDAVNKKMESLESSGGLNRIVEDAFVRKYHDDKRHFEKFGDVLRNAASKAAEKFIEDHVKISKV